MRGGGVDNTTMKQNWTFLESNQTLQSLDPSACVTPDGTTNEQTAVVICRTQQTNENLLLFQQKQNLSSVLWRSQVSLTQGDYWAWLQGDGNLVTTQGLPGDGGVVVWDSNSISVEADYRLVWDVATQGMQIERVKNEKNGSLVMIWRTVSNLNGSGSDNKKTQSKPDNDLVWNPVPVPSPSAASRVAALVTPTPAPGSATAPLSR